MYREYGFVIVFVGLGVILGLGLFLLSYILILRQYDIEKISAYECGFDPFEETRNKFDVRYYLVSILFIIFDLEVTFLFPWSVVLKSIDMLGYWVMMLFLVILVIGFVYEWMRGALEWE